MPTGARTCALVLLSVLTLGSIGALAYSLSTMSSNVRDANEDFDTLSSLCPIVAVYHKHRTYFQINSKSNSCFDDYVYLFAWCLDGDRCLPTAAPAGANSSDLSPRVGMSLTYEEYAGSYSYAEYAAYRDWTSSSLSVIPTLRARYARMHARI